MEEGVKGRNKVDVKLAPSVVNLGEVVAIGYGTQTRKEITGSVANVLRKTSTRVLIVMLQICYKVKWLVCRLLLALVM